MSWLIIVLIAYFLMSIVALFDRYFLVGPIANPKTYTFYIGIFGLIFCLFFIPFGVSFPAINIIFLGLIAGLIRMLANLFLTTSITKSEISRVAPAVGAMQPIFSFLLFFLFLPQSRILDISQLVAFVLLVFGSILISTKKFDREFFNFENLKYPITASFLYSLTFFLTKNLFLKTNFLSGLFLILLGSGLAALGFLIFPQNRKIILNQKMSGRISGLLLLGQALGGSSLILQYYAVFLAKPGQVPLINALEGTRYVFLLFFVFLLGKWRPQLLKEEISKEVILQKIIAILFIGGGLTLLVL
jgi:uncharacterized membrane protein YidH (DUF202 family)